MMRFQHKCTISALVLSLLLSGLTTLFSCPSAQAIVKVESTESVNYAVKYGLKKKDLGISAILGPNWIEGEEGTLLNIYTPFMLIATQASKKSVNGTSDKDIKEAKKRMSRILSQITDPRTPQEIKFSVALYGDRPNFGGQYTATIEGEGRGRSVTLKPSRVILDKIGNANTEASLFEAINAYYFRFSDLENLDTFKLILKSPQDEKTFTIHAEEIY